MVHMMHDDFRYPIFLIIRLGRPAATKNFIINAYESRKLASSIRLNLLDDL